MLPDFVAPLQNEIGFTALMAAAANGHFNIAKLILDHDLCDINKQFDDRFTALMLATYNEHFDLVELLVERGADVNIYFLSPAFPSTNFQMDALMITAFSSFYTSKFSMKRKNYLKIAKYLISRGVS